MLKKLSQLVRERGQAQTTTANSDPANAPVAPPAVVPSVNTDSAVLNDINIVPLIRSGVISKHSYATIDPTAPEWRTAHVITKAGEKGEDDDLCSGYLGTSHIHPICKHCGCKANTCVGHKGYIALAKPVIKPMMASMIVKLLKVLCPNFINGGNCTGIVMSVLSFQHLQDRDKLKAMAKKIKHDNISACINCVGNSAKVMHVTAVNDLGLAYHISYGKDHPVTDEYVYTLIEHAWAMAERRYGGEAGAREFFAKLGFVGSRPHNMITTIVPVMPPMYRPSYIDATGSVVPHDFTVLYNKIIECNDKIRNNMRIGERATSAAMLVLVGDLAETVSALERNPKEKFKNPISNKVIRGVADQLNRREGFIREIMVAKRTEQTGRSGIAPDESLSYDQVSVPEYMRFRLTTPTIVSSYNLRQCCDRIMRGEVAYVSTSLKPMAQHAPIRVTSANAIRLSRNLAVGHQIHCFLTEGDRALFNRQPTLHGHSIMGVRLTFHANSNSFRFKADVATPYNADFDGDEMNLHLPQTLEARAEMKYLVSVEDRLINREDFKAAYGLIYDSLVAAQLMTRGNGGVIADHVWRDCIEILRDGGKNSVSMASLEARLRMHQIPSHTGRALMSAIMPHNFTYSSEGLVIKNGICVEGTGSKKQLGNAHNSVLVAIRYYTFGTEEQRSYEMRRFYDVFPRIASIYLQHMGYTFGTADIAPSQLPKDIIDKKKALEQRVATLRADIEAVSAGASSTVLAAKLTELLQTPPTMSDSYQVNPQDPESVRAFVALDQQQKQTRYQKAMQAHDTKIANIRRVLTQPPAQLAYLTRELNTVMRELNAIPTSGQSLRNQLSYNATQQLVLATYAQYPEGRSKLTAAETTLREAIMIKDVSDAATYIQAATINAIDKDSAFPVAWESGAKGTKGNAAQLVGAISQQYHNSVRMVGDRLPYYISDSFDPEAAGFCPQSFGSRNTVQGTVEVATASRDNLVDIGVNTSYVGALKKRIIDAVKDINTEYDMALHGGVNGVMYLPLHGGTGVGSHSKVMTNIDGVAVGSFIDIASVVQQINHQLGY